MDDMERFVTMVNLWNEMVSEFPEEARAERQQLANMQRHKEKNNVGKQSIRFFLSF